MKTLSIETTTHGRVLVREANDPAAMVIGFHGYMENAEIQMARLEALPGNERWTLVAVQGLHRFYHGRSERVVASWMTRQDREAMIGDNIVYADCVVAALGSIEVPVVMAGFSQGVAMAFRAGVRGRRRAAAIIAVGGDVPPELLSDANLTFPAALIVRGEQDDWYTAVKLTADVSALASRGTPVETFVHPGGHEWTTDVSAAAASFIGRLRDEPI